MEKENNIMTDKVIKDQIKRYLTSKNKFTKFLKIMITLTIIIMIGAATLFILNRYIMNWNNKYFNYGAFGGAILVAILISSILMPMTSSKNNKRVFLENIEFHLDPNSSIESVSINNEEEIDVTEANVIGISSLAIEPDVQIKEGEIDLSEENPSHLQASFMKASRLDHFNPHDDVIFKELMFENSLLITNTGTIIRNLVREDVILKPNILAIASGKDDEYVLLVYKYKRELLPAEEVETTNN